MPEYDIEDKFWSWRHIQYYLLIEVSLCFILAGLFELVFIFLSNGTGFSSSSREQKYTASPCQQPDHPR